MILFEDLRLMVQTKKSLSSQDLLSYKRGLKKLDQLIIENKEVDFQTLWHKHDISFIYFTYIKDFASLHKEILEAKQLLNKFPTFNTNVKKTVLNAYELEISKFSTNQEGNTALILQIGESFAKGTSNWVAFQASNTIVFSIYK